MRGKALANKIGHPFTLDCGHEGVVTWVSEDEKTFYVRGTKRKCGICGKGTGGNWAPTTYIFSEDVDEDIEKKIDESSSSSQLKPKRSIRMKCSECGGTSFVRDEELGEVICRTCGCVVVERLTRAGPEWRAFNNEQRAKRERVGAPVTFTIHDKGLSTFIGKSNRDTYGKNLSSEKRQQIHRLRKWQQRIRVSNSAERNLASALSDLANLSSSMNLPRNVSETASIIYRKALSKRLIRGRSIKSVLTAVLYMSCRLCGVARTLDEFSKSSGLDKKEIGRTYRFVVKKLGEFIPPQPPRSYISRFSNQLKLNGSSELIALRVLKAAESMRLTDGRGPISIAAAATYIASVLSGDRRTQREVAETAYITEVTIRNRYKELLETLDICIKL